MPAASRLLRFRNYPGYLRRKKSSLLSRSETLRTPTGATRVKIPLAAKCPSFYVFALHKSGSVLLNSMITMALDHVGFPHIALPEAAFSAGLMENNILNPEDFIFPTGYCYRGFRSFPPYLGQFNIADNKKVLLVRDPRDILVSLYFSMKYSHLIPETGVMRQVMLRERQAVLHMDVDRFCLSRAGRVLQEFQQYFHLLSTEIRVYRYQDVIFQKHEWLADMLDYFGIKASHCALGKIVTIHDALPDVEHPMEHIRQVTPGNFTKHLRPDTIRKLNIEFLGVLKQYDYIQSDCGATT